MVKPGISSMSQAPAYLMQGIESVLLSEKKLDVDAKQVKSVLALLVQDATTQGNIDDLIVKECDNWLIGNDLMEKENIKKIFGQNGEQLLAAIPGDAQMVHYMIISALLNSKKNKEDIKVFSWEEVVAHLKTKNIIKNPTSEPKRYAELEVIFLLKLFLEQDLIPCIVAMKNGDDLSAYPRSNVECARRLWDRMKTRHGHCKKFFNGSVLQLLQAAKDFNADALSLVAPMSFGWIIAGVTFIASLLLAIFLKVFYL